MRRLRTTDSAQHTVILVQVENEVGMIPDARDHGAAANAAFSPVPAELTSYLSRNRDSLEPISSRHGRRMEPRSEQIGRTRSAPHATDELFTAWTEADYTGEIAARGKHSVRCRCM